MIKVAQLILTYFTLFTVLIIAIPGSVLAQDSEQATGLNQPTAEQAEWMKQNFPVIQKICLNSLALERINAHRKASGLDQLPAAVMDLTTLGKEAVFPAIGEINGETTSELSEGLPSSVDNSTSTAFPPIRSQGALGSCASWATTYYQFTYETNLALGRTGSGGDNTVIFSPKWTYNMINGGVDGGSSISAAYNLEFKNGAATWADFPYDSNYLAWDMNSLHWNKAISYRIQSSGSIYNSNVDTMINNIKTQITNGHIMVFATYVTSWVQKMVGNDPSTVVDDAFVNQKIASYEKNTAQGGHSMTIVGYNDDLWCDLNGNGTVDINEKGAFKIANSWGTGDWNGGYRWITYDSLRTTSAGPTSGTWPTNDRASGGIFWNGTVYTISVSSYTPNIKAEITLNQAKRGQVAVTLGLGSTTATMPTTTWTSKAVYNTGGNWAFNGTTTAVDGTFVFDFSDLAKVASGTNRWFVAIRDSTAGDITTIKSFKLYQDDALVATASGLPRTTDAGQVYIWVDYAPTATISGHVYQADGATPIAGAYVSADSLNNGNSIGAYSAANGSYVINGLTAGSFRVYASADGYVGEYYYGTYFSNQATPVTVTVPNNTPGIDFSLETVDPKLAIFSPGGTWFIDTNDNGAFDTGDWSNSPNTFGRQVGDVPLAIDWNGDGVQELAIFRPGGTWFIDVNHNGAFDAGVDWTNSPNTLGKAVGDMPLAIDWNGDGIQELAIFRQGGTWFIDLNHNGAFDVGVDWTNSPNTFGRAVGDMPLAIDWNGDGIQELAIFRPGGTWFIDLNHNGAFDVGVDWTNSPNTFGRNDGDIPLAIDWNGDGIQELAIFRSGIWYGDMNHNGIFEQGIDLTTSPNTFGRTDGDVPIAIWGW